MSSTVALKDFYNTWFNSPENKADIEASFRNTADSGCPLMHAMVVARCTKPQGCVLRCGENLLSARVFAGVGPKNFCKKADESPFKDVGLADYSWRSPILWQGQVLLHQSQLMPVPSLQLMPVPVLPLMFSSTTNLWPFFTFILKQVTVL